MSIPIELSQIRKVFGAGPDATAAVAGVSLTIDPGELFFLLGPSGCGKTTLLRMIAGFIDPTSGRIAFADRDVTYLPPNRRNTGMVFQSYALWPHMTVEQNIAFGLNVRRVSAEDRTKRVREALEAVQMGGYGARKPNQLSGGQQQRIALARALVVRPDVLLLDEPLSNLDAKLRIELRAEIRRICKSAGITTVYVTHDQKEALSMADRIAIMRSGLVVQLGTPGDLYRSPATPFVAEFLGETNFVHGTIEKAGAGELAVRTPAGVLTSRHEASLRCSNGQPVLVSLRPEALEFADRAGADGANTIRGEVIETTYLGELAQHLVRVGEGVLLKVAELNPVPEHAAGRREAHDVRLTVAPEHVVVLNPDTPPSGAPVDRENPASEAAAVGA